jgi:hypothetical protein
MEYREYIFTNKDEIIELLNKNQNVVEVIIGAINGIDDQKWLEELCIKYLFNEDFEIARTALYGIGHIARMYGTLLNKGLIEKQFVKIKDEKLNHVLQDVKDDLDIFLKKNKS